MKKNRPVVGEMVHYVPGDRVGVYCKAAVIVDCGDRYQHLRILRDNTWKKYGTIYKGYVSYSKKPLHHTWHRLEDCPTGKKK